MRRNSLSRIQVDPFCHRQPGIIRLSIQSSMRHFWRAWLAAQKTQPACTALGLDQYCIHIRYGIIQQLAAHSINPLALWVLQGSCRPPGSRA